MKYQRIIETPFGFNEAPIHESGKSPSASAAKPSISCFNEAPIHESGKSREIGHRSDRRCRGFNEAPIHESGKSSKLERSRFRATSFNEAPIHESGKSCGVAS